MGAGMGMARPVERSMTPLIRSAIGLVYLIGGVALSSWAAFESRGAPFLAGSKFTPTGRDGSYPLLLIIIGIVVAGYGF